MAKQRKHGTGSVWTKPTLNNWYISFYRDGDQHQVNTKIPKVGKDDAETLANRKAAEKMLETEVAKRTLEITSDILSINKITYEAMRDNLVAAFQRDGKASLSVGKDGKSRLVGQKWLDKYFEGMTADKMADRLSAYPAFVKKQDEVQATWQERFDREELFQLHVKKMPKKTANTEARRAADMAVNATINRSLSTLRSMYSQFASDFPKRMREGDIPTMPRIASENSDNVGQGFVTPEIYENIYNAMPANLQPLTQFLYFTGMRSGAAKQITWNMVEWEKVGGKQVATGLQIPPGLMKNREAYSIPLVGPLAPIAATLSQGEGFRAVDMPIFDDTNFRRVFNKVAASLGLGVLDPKTQAYIGLHPHDFRRSAARNLVRAGASQSVAMKVTGHKSARMFERYNITDTTDVADALVAVGEYSKAAQEAAVAKGATKAAQKAFQR
jgi:integrase